MCLCDQHSDRVKRSMREKNGERRKPGNKSKGRHSNGSAHHVLFRYSHFQKTVGMRLRKFVGFRRVSQIRIQNHNGRVLPSELAQGITKYVPQRFHFATSSISSSRRAISSSLLPATLACHSNFPSVN